MANIIPSEKRSSLSELLFFVDLLSKQIKESDDFSPKKENLTEKDENQGNNPPEQPSDLSLEQELSKKLDEIESTSELERIVPGKAWMSGVKILDTLKVVLDDVCFDKGGNTNFFLNYVHQLDALNQMKAGIKIPAENDNDEEFIKPIEGGSTQEAPIKDEALDREEVEEEEYKPMRKRGKITSRLNKLKKENSEEIPQSTQQTQAEPAKKPIEQKEDLAYTIEEDDKDEDFQPKGKREKTTYKDFKRQDNKDYSSERFVDRNEDRREPYNNRGKWGDKDDKWGKKSGFDNRERGDRSERRDFQRNRDNRNENNRYERDNRRDNKWENREDRGFDRKRGYGSENRRNFEGEQRGNYKRNFQEGEQGGSYNKKFMRNTENDFKNYEQRGGYEKKFDKFDDKRRNDRKFDGGSTERRGKKEYLYIFHH